MAKFGSSCWAHLPSATRVDGDRYLTPVAGRAAGRTSRPRAGRIPGLRTGSRARRARCAPSDVWSAKFPGFHRAELAARRRRGDGRCVQGRKGEGEYYKLDTLHQRRSPIVGGLTVRAATRRRQKMPSRMHGGSILGGARCFDGVCGQGTWSLWNTSAAAAVHRCVSNITASKSRLCRLASTQESICSSLPRRQRMFTSDAAIYFCYYFTTDDWIFIAMLTRAIDIRILSVRPSVTFRYCIETA